MIQAHSTHTRQIITLTTLASAVLGAACTRPPQQDATFPSALDYLLAAKPHRLPIGDVVTELWDRGVVGASGAFVQRADSLGTDGVYISYISCERQTWECQEVSYDLYLPPVRDTYHIAVWDQNEIISRPLDFPCGRNVLRINRAQQKVVLTNSPINGTSRDCKSLPSFDGVWELVAGRDLNPARDSAYERLRDSVLRSMR